MKIYIVHGTCGEYSDRTEWSVCAYDEEHLARAHVEAAEIFAREHAPDPFREDNEEPPPNPWDQNGYHSRYDTPKYWYTPTELKKCH